MTMARFCASIRLTSLLSASSWHMRISVCVTAMLCSGSVLSAARTISCDGTLVCSGVTRTYAHNVHRGFEKVATRARARQVRGKRTCSIEEHVVQREGPQWRRQLAQPGLDQARDVVNAGIVLVEGSAGRV